MDYLPDHLPSCEGTVQAFDRRFRLSLSVDSAFRRWSASLALPTNRPTMPSADFYLAVGAPCDTLSPRLRRFRLGLSVDSTFRHWSASLALPTNRLDTKQTSRGKFDRLPRTVAGFTLRALDGYGLYSGWPVRPALTPQIRFLYIDSRVCSPLPLDLTSR